jgi:DNA-binding transcriptional MerR regulator
MHTISNELTPPQIKALPHLVGANSITEGAKKAGVNPRTVHRWMEEDAFKKEYHKQTWRLADIALNHLATNTNKAVETLLSLLDSENDIVKLRAARDIINMTTKLKLMSEWEQRIEELEQLAEVG